MIPAFKPTSERERVNKTALYLTALLSSLLILGIGYYAYAFTGPTTSAGVGGGAVRTDSSKNISVGTISPSANTKFLIQASSTSASDYSLRVVQPDGSTPLLIVRNDGKIGIAANPTSTALNVGGDAYISGSVTATTFSGSLTGTLNAANVSSGVFGSNTSFGNFTFGTSTNPILHIDNTNARVGIGTTGPGQKLEVVGNVSSTALCLGGTCQSSWSSGGVTGSGTSTQVAFWSGASALSSDSNLHWDNTNKRLGIGATTPSATLEVSGNAVASSYREGYASKTATFTLSATESFIACDAAAGAITANLPSAASAGAGREYTVKKIDSSANACTLDGNGTETIDGSVTAAISSQWHSLTIVSTGSAWLIK